MQKILIVDDSASIRQSFLEILSPLAECELATNGREAIERIKQRQGRTGTFDLVIMDVIMPEKDGLTTVKEIREYEARTGIQPADSLTIVIVTTINDPARILIAQYECGADAYIAKPFTAETVLQTLSNNGLVVPSSSNIRVDNDSQ